MTTAMILYVMHVVYCFSRILIFSSGFRLSGDLLYLSCNINIIRKESDDSFHTYIFVFVLYFILFLFYYIIINIFIFYLFLLLLYVSNLR